MSDVDYGPQAEAVHAIEERFKTLTEDEKKKLVALRDDAFWEGWNMVSDGRASRAGLRAARNALGVRLCGFFGDYATYGAALAVLLRHTFTAEEWPHYTALVKPWVTVTGIPAHPDDRKAQASGKAQSPIKGTLSPGVDELDAIATMVDLFKGLDNDARSRVIYYLSNRFKVDAT